MTWRPLYCLALLGLFAHCAQDDVSSHENTRAPGTAKAKDTTAPPVVAPTPPADRKRPPAASPLVVVSVAATTISAAVAENAAGERVSTPSGTAVAIDIQLESLPGRALDPVLEIGGVTFRSYEARPDNVLRFVLATPALAEAGPAVLRWGRDVLELANTLSVQ